MISKLSITGKREKNEDAFIVEKIYDICLLAVADGLGGHLGGEMASKLAIYELKTMVEKLLLNGETYEKILKKGYEKANFEIRDISTHDPEYYNMGTTLVSALIKGDLVTLANLGDSRAYLIREKEIKQLTKDHSLVQEMVDKGIIRKEQAFRHPMGNVISKALGFEKKAEPDIQELKLNENDILLLCSDGLSDYLKEEEIKEIVIGSEDLENAAKTLVDTALENGSSDNITVVLCESPP